MWFLNCGPEGPYDEPSFFRYSVNLAVTKQCDKLSKKFNKYDEVYWVLMMTSIFTHTIRTESLKFYHTVHLVYRHGHRQKVEQPEY